MSKVFVFLGDLFGILLTKDFLWQLVFLVLSFELTEMWEHLAFPQEKMRWGCGFSGVERFVFMMAWMFLIFNLMQNFKKC